MQETNEQGAEIRSFLTTLGHMPVFSEENNRWEAAIGTWATLLPQDDGSLEILTTLPHFGSILAMCTGMACVTFDVRHHAVRIDAWHWSAMRFIIGFLSKLQS